jgi:hypothetical protein
MDPSSAGQLEHAQAAAAVTNYTVLQMQSQPGSPAGEGTGPQQSTFEAITSRRLQNELSGQADIH